MGGWVELTFGAPPGEEEFYGSDESRAVCFNWDDLSEVEQLLAKTFAEGVANSLTEFPPDLDVRLNSDGDLMLVLHVGALSADYSQGPIWHCLLKDALTELGDDGDWELEDRRALLRALMRLALQVAEQMKPE